jgi:membrane protein
MLRALRIPIGWGDLVRRTYAEVLADNCLGLAAQLAYYFFLALFPALLFLLAIISFVPIQNLMDTITTTLGRVAPSDVLNLIREQIIKIAQDKDGGLLTLGMLGTIWSTSSGMTAIIDTLNQAYDIQEARTWWKVRLTAVGLTVALAVFIVGSTVLVVAGPAIADKVAGWFHLGTVFALTWKIVQWPLVFALVSVGIAIIYYFAPDAEQEWLWITPGSILATTLWLLISLGFRIYVTNFGS